MTPPPTFPRPPRTRGIFCNRTLNLRAIRAIGYDMDYTLVHYRVDEWERRAYEYLQAKFTDLGWPVQSLTFDPAFIVRGLIIDMELGNVLKANRFGYVKRAYHGTRQLDFEAQRAAYARTIVDLSEPRYVFLNTLFTLSEGCMYAQLVDLLDARTLPEVLSYDRLYDRVRTSIDEAHVEGQLKAEILADPDRFVEPDPEAPLALLDQRKAGKKLLLITNSEWSYTKALMAYAFDRFLPQGMRWRDLFDLVVISAEVGMRKPNVRIFEHVSRALGLDPHEILFVGDTPHEDVIGAKRAGMRVAWINKHRKDFPAGIAEPDLVINDLAELPERLGC